MEAFAKAFRERLSEKIAHGMRAKVAKAANVRPAEVTNWGKPLTKNRKSPRWQIPTIFEIFNAAQALDVSPAWLAFGESPNQEEARWVNLIRGLNDQQRQNILNLLESMQATQFSMSADALAEIRSIEKPTAQRARKKQSMPPDVSVIAKSEFPQALADAAKRVGRLAVSEGVTPRQADTLSRAVGLISSLTPDSTQTSQTPTHHTSETGNTERASDDKF